MRLSVASPSFLWQSCAEPSAAWFLVWMPLALLALDGEARPTSAMARLLAVLMVSALIWARGLGPGGRLAERLFVSGWAGAWAAALGILIIFGDGSSSFGGSTALMMSLIVGAGWLSWASHERQGLEASRRRRSPFEASSSEPAGTSTIVSAWLLAVLVFALLLLLGRAHWSDGLVLATSLGCFTLFQLGQAKEGEASG